VPRGAEPFLQADTPEVIRLIQTLDDQCIIELTMKPKPLPRSKQEAFIDSPLYAAFSLEGWEDDDTTKFFLGGGTLDAWCPKCGKNSVFRIQSKLPGYNEAKKNLPLIGILEIASQCSRGAEDSYSGCRYPLFVLFLKEHDEVRKVGQSPSAADLAFGSLDPAFSKELGVSERRELGTALGLHAHRVGIGSFVYLRRIFESLLDGARHQAESEEGWDVDKYARSRVSERIRLLSKHLPSRLVESADLYGLLSAGIHELSEEKCLETFGLVQSAIELILKERHEDKRYSNVIKRLDAGQDIT
jgi:hypothetical protein